MSFPIILLLEVVAVFGTLHSGQYVNPPPGDFRVNWTLDDVNETITFNIDCDIHGWVGIAWSAVMDSHSSGRLNFYAAVLNASSQQFSIVDGYATSISVIQRDTNTNHVINGQVTRVGDVTSMSFTRKLETDVSDTSIVPDQLYHLIWCYHSNDEGFDLKTKHDYYGSVLVDFLIGPLDEGRNKGPFRPSKAPTPPTPPTIAPTIASSRAPSTQTETAACPSHEAFFSSCRPEMLRPGGGCDELCTAVTTLLAKAFQAGGFSPTTAAQCMHEANLNQTTPWVPGDILNAENRLTSSQRICETGLNSGFALAPGMLLLLCSALL